MRFSSALASIGLHILLVASIVAGAYWSSGQTSQLASRRNTEPSLPHIEMLQQAALTGDGDTTAGAAPRAAAPSAGEAASGNQAIAAPAPAATVPSPTLPTTGLAMATQPASASLIQLPPKVQDITPPAPPSPPDVPAPAPQVALANPAPPVPAVIPQAASSVATQAAIKLPPPPAPTPQEALDKAIGTAVASGAGIIPPSPDSRRNVPPRYPEDAKRRGIEGRVLLLIDVSAEGNVIGVDLERGSGSASLDRAARDAALHWHFHPALSGDTEVESNFETEIIFQLTDK